VQEVCKRIIQQAAAYEWKQMTNGKDANSTRDQAQNNSDSKMEIIDENPLKISNDLSGNNNSASLGCCSPLDDGLSPAEIIYDKSNQVQMEEEKQEERSLQTKFETSNGAQERTSKQSKFQGDL